MGDAISRTRRSRRRGRGLKWACILIAAVMWLLIPTSAFFTAQFYYERSSIKDWRFSVISVTLGDGAITAFAHLFSPIAVSKPSIRAPLALPASAGEPVTIQRLLLLRRPEPLRGWLWCPRIQPLYDVSRTNGQPTRRDANMVIPLYLLALPPTLLALFLHRRDRRLDHRLKHNLCTRCGYHLAGIAGEAPCPECGRAPAPSTSPE